LVVVRTICVPVLVDVVDVGSGDVFISTRAPIVLMRSTLSAVATVVVVRGVAHDPVSAGGIASDPEPAGGVPIGGGVVSDVAVTVEGICGWTSGGEPDVDVGVPPAPPVDATVPVLPGVSVFDCTAPDRPVGPIAITL
jgi:hypothetical protein